MSINRSRWLDKLRPAGASSSGWTEGPMAPVETTDAATVDQRCSFKHWAGWRHNHSNSKLCVAVRMGRLDGGVQCVMHRTAGEKLAELSVCSWATHQIPFSANPTLCNKQGAYVLLVFISATHRIVVNDHLKRQTPSETLLQISRQFIVVINPRAEVSKRLCRRRGTEAR